MPDKVPLACGSADLLKARREAVEPQLLAAHRRPYARHRPAAVSPAGHIQGQAGAGLSAEGAGLQSVSVSGRQSRQTRLGQAMRQ